MLSLKMNRIVHSIHCYINDFHNNIDYCTNYNRNNLLQLFSQNCIIVKKCMDYVLKFCISNKP